MYVVSFHQIFNENAMVLAQRLHVPFVIELTPKDGDIIIVFGSHEQADKLYYIQQNYDIKFIIIQTEQFDSKIFDNKYYMSLIENNPIVEWSKLNVERLKSKINTKVYSLYFYDFFGVDKLPNFNDRKIDYFFTGAKNAEREKLIEDFKRSNPKAVFEIDFSYSYTNPVMLTQKLLTVKYVINIPFYKGNALETHRINRALSLGCEVISLLSADQDMNRKYSPYVHFVTSLTEFTTLIEQEPRANYTKLLEDFGTREIENNLRGFFYAEKVILEERKKKLQETKPEEVIEPLKQPVSTDFSKFIAMKKLNEKKE
jgi:hypothetical protein